MTESFSITRLAVSARLNGLCVRLRDARYWRTGAGGGAEVRFPWGRFGEQSFVVEVESGEEEVALADNRTFQYVSLIPQHDIVVFPNPFRPRSDSALRFGGVPFKAEVRVCAPTGELR